MTANISVSQLNDTGVDVMIRLRVQDNNILNRIHPLITVRPRPGTIRFTPTVQECMFLEVGHTYVISTLYLNTTTDFEDQSPEIAYDVLEAPIDGRLEVYEANRWSLVSETITSRRLESPRQVIGYFTQRDIDNGHVRFVHTGESGSLSTLKFRLRSSLLIQASHEQVCFHIIDDYLLIQPEFVIEPGTVLVTEDKSALINPDVIAASLTEQDVLYAPQSLGVNIKIEQLEPVFILEAVPNVGEIRVRGEAISSGGNFSLDEFRSNLVYYHNNGEEVFNDSFAVRMIPTVGVPLIKQPHPSEVVTVVISIDPVNDHPPTVRLNDITVTEGSFRVITPDHILVEDSDLSVSADGTLRENILTISFRRPRSNRPSVSVVCV